MSASDDDKPICDVATPDFSAQVAHLPTSLPPKRGRGRPRKVQPPVPPPAAAAAVVEPEPEPQLPTRVPTPPPCSHQSGFESALPPDHPVAVQIANKFGRGVPPKSPPLSVDSDSDSSSDDAGFVCGTSNDVRSAVTDRESEIELLNEMLDLQNDNNKILLEENAKLRARLADPAFEDPDHTWDIYLLGASSGLAVGVLLRKLAAMMF